MNAGSIVGYTFNADTYCEHCIAVMFEREESNAPNIFDGAERILDDEAHRRGIDRHSEETFDSGDFPKVLLASMANDGDICGNCHEEILG